MSINNNNNNSKTTDTKIIKESDFHTHTEVILRTAENDKAKLKEKFVQHFENFFSGKKFFEGEPEKFFPDFFLLKVNHNFLERCMVLTSEDQLFFLKESFHLLFEKILEFMENDHPLRAQHAIEIATNILKNLFRKKFEHFGLDVANILIPHAHEKENVDFFFEKLIKKITAVLCSEKEQLVQYGSVILFTICMATDNINQNVLLDHFLPKNLTTNQFFESIFRSIHNFPKNSKISQNIFYSLSVITNYKKFEIQNSYLERIRNLKGATEVFIQVIRFALFYLKRENKKNFTQTAPPSTINWLASYVVPSYLSSSETTLIEDETNENFTTCSLLILYEFLSHNSEFTFYLLPFKDEVANTLILPPEDQTKNPNFDVLNNFSKNPELLVELLKFSSFLFSSSSLKARSVFQTKLIVIIFQLLCENPNALQILFSTEFIFEVSLFIKIKNGITTFKQPLIIPLVEVLLQYLKNNTKKTTLNTDIFSKCLTCLSRIILYQKDSTTTTTRINWTSFWPAFLQLFKFIIKNNQNETNLDFINLASQAAEILNLFIAFNSELLEGTELYSFCYEIAHNQEHIRSIYQIIEKNQPSNTNIWVNINGVVNHLDTALEQWKSKYPNSSPNDDQIKSIFHTSFESFRVVEPSTSDRLPIYIENPKESSFFRQLIRNLVVDAKLNQRPL